MTDAGSIPLIFGDSIGVRAQMGYGIAQDTDMARVGAAPDEVRNKIANYSGDLSGRDVILSSGTSNNPSEIGKVREQLALLKQRGAKNVYLLGVSSQNANYDGCNDTLQAMAGECGATFVPIPDTTGDPMNVHPPVKALHHAIKLAHAKQSVPDSLFPASVEPARLETADYSLPRRETRAAPSKPEYLSKDALPKMTSAELHKIQEALIKENAKAGYKKYDLGAFGRNHDGDDGVKGIFTSHAIQDYEREHNLGNVGARELIANLQIHADSVEHPTSPSGGPAGKGSGVSKVRT